MTDFETWLLDVGRDRIFRMLEYRRIGDWTPHEMENKYIDQSEFKSCMYQFVMIKEAIELPDGDVLLGLVNIEEWSDLQKNDDKWINYRKLSQIELVYSPQDQEEERWD